MLDLGTPAPAFALRDVMSGMMINLDTFANKQALLVMFICPHCPFVKYVNQELARIGKDYLDRPIGIVAIQSNDVAQFPEDGRQGMLDQMNEFGFPFPYCFDETQDIARAYKAACTPDFFLFDAARKLVYRGQLDDSRPSNPIPVTGADLRAAIDATLAGEPVPATQKSSIGCNIKWKP
jgi:thiol-disulfide isomerase/thioredoxin